MKQIVFILHNIRSTHNVGSLLRTADGLGINKLYFTGYTPYPQSLQDKRLPHESKQIANKIRKTALGAEDTVEWEYKKSIDKLISTLRQDGYKVYALEQTSNSVELTSLKPNEKIAVILGNETEGIDSSTLKLTDLVAEIPMAGSKESLNVSVAGAIAMYYLRNMA